MRTLRTLLAALALCLVANARAGASDVGFSDVICPEATQYVVAVGKLRKDDPPQRIYDAAQAATDAYQRCSKDKLSNGFREAQHYADTRGSAFAVVAARALVSLNRPEDARRELELWRPLAQQVVDWISETQTSVSGHKPTENPMQGETGTVFRSDHRRSMYYESAKQIVAAIDAEVAAIDTSLRDRPRTQGRGTPAPAPTANP